MVSFHPDSRFLTDFTTGSLGLSESLCVATHLHYCGKCRARVQQLGDLGGHLFSRLAPEPPTPDSFDALMQRIDAETGESPVEEVPSRPRPDNLAGRLPAALGWLVREGLDRLNWVQMGRALRIAPVDLGEPGRETAIYDIRAGSRMPAHAHRGEEITVLLKGSFSDQDGKYGPGDFVVRNAGEPHQPTATEDSDCLCLISLEKPVRPRSVWYRLLEPYVKYRLSRRPN